MTKRALVIGGGIAGIQTALDIADAGFEVDIVEKSPTIGGKMAQLDKTFPTLDCAACILTPKMVDAAAHEKIRLFTYSEVEKVKGFVGNFTVDIRKKARSIREEKCTGCGACTEKCPSKKTGNEFNERLDNRPAIYIPFAQAIPNIPSIDREACIHFKTGKCGLCQKACGVGAIDFDQQDEIITGKYGAIVAATGFQPISVERFDEFQYSKSPDVITSLELERLMNAAGPTKGELVKPSSRKHPNDMVFVQCVGSRGESCREKSYCSKICCMYTAKHAMMIRDKYPDIHVHVFYIDVRTPGKNFDEFYRRAVEDYGVDYRKGMVGKVMEQKDGKLLVQASDLLTGEQLLLHTDMVVLATAIEPDKSARALATMLTASMDTNDFFYGGPSQAEARGKSHCRSIFIRNVPGSQRHSGDSGPGRSSRSKVIGLLSRKKLLNNPQVAKAEERLCSGCSGCSKVCPYGAIDYEVREIWDHGVRQTRG